MHRDDTASGQDYELISKQYYESLLKERIELTLTVLPEIRNRLRAARELGDLSENAEYQSEVNKKIIYEQKLNRINQIINKALVFDVSQYKDKTFIHIGAHVQIVNIQDNTEFNCQIVSMLEANYNANKISYKSDIAKLLIGKKIGEIIEIRNRKFKITCIKYEN